MSILSDILVKNAAPAVDGKTMAEVVANTVVTPSVPVAPEAPRPVFSEEVTPAVVPAEEAPVEAPEAPAEEAPEVDAPAREDDLIDKVDDAATDVLGEIDEVLKDTFGSANRDVDADNEVANEGTSQERPKWVDDAFGKTR